MPAEQPPKYRVGDCFRYRGDNSYYLNLCEIREVHAMRPANQPISYIISKPRFKLTFRPGYEWFSRTVDEPFLDKHWYPVGQEKMAAYKKTLKKVK